MGVIVGRLAVPKLLRGTFTSGPLKAEVYTDRPFGASARWNEAVTVEAEVTVAGDPGVTLYMKPVPCPPTRRLLFGANTIPSAPFRVVTRVGADIVNVCVTLS